MNPFDLQVNGYGGVDFGADDLCGEDLQKICIALENDGFDSILATLITDSVENLSSKLARLVRLRSENPLATRLIAGFHVEGPFLNPSAGYIGAHDPTHVTSASKDDALRLIEASEGRLKLVTLAPECDPGFEAIRAFASQGVTVSAGHCDPSLDTLEGAIDSGLRMMTHLGNGCPVNLPRHDNIVQRALSLRERLWICFIPDGIHIAFFALKNYLDLVGIDRAIMVTDAISATGLGPGRHQLSGMTVEVDASGAARRPGQPNLAGSTLAMPQLIDNLRDRIGLDETQIRALVETNPRAALERVP